MNTPFFQKRILLGVTGSIAAYKAADLASKLAQYGAQVDVILTQAATQFITPLTFQSVTGQHAWIDADLWGAQGHVLHIGLGHSADLLVVAPASANTISRLANGIADNLLSLTALVANCPLVIAPAMDGGMYQHPATQANLETLRQRGAILLGPASGHLASGLSGVGRMLEPAEILGHLRHLLGSSGPMQGKTVVVTASGTQEPIDPVRAICNRSSGKQGFALAQAALDLGAQVILITAPTALPTPVGATRVEVNTADEMLHAVERAVRNADVLLMAAAVADFRPVAAADHKIKKDTGIPQIFLEKTSDILSAIASQRSATGYPRIMVGFAAESENLLENARSKMRSKHLDMIVANDISATDYGFAVDDNRVTLLDSMGGVEELPLQSKAEVAATIMQRVVVGLSNIG